MFLSWTLWIALLTSTSSMEESNDKHIQARYVDVETTAGTLRGKVVEYPIEYPEGNKSSIKLTQFLGVPYARPPVGDLRWKNPENVEQWEGVRNATAYGKSCLQTNWGILVPHTPMSEDCLFLNIWVPGNSLDKMGRLTPQNLTVMFWIHAGGFQVGTGSLDINNGALLAHDQNVVVLTINYRLNAFGFLSTESKQDEGNWGLKDCVLGLQWVQDNIKSFGGDPNSVTIFGESAGSAAVSLLMLSRQAKGLFKRAIAQSGSAFNFWAMNRCGTNHMIQQNLARNLGCLVDNDMNSLECLMSKNPMDILTETGKLPLFVPNVDGTFIHDEPENILENGDFVAVDFINGFTSHEGFFYAARTIKLDEDDIGIGYNSSQFNNQVSSLKSFFKHPENWDLIQHGVRLMYDDYTVDNDIKSVQRSMGFIDFISDFGTSAGSHKFVALYTKKSAKKAFCYFMNTKISKDFQYIPYVHRRPDWVNTAHADDTQFVFGHVKYTNKTVTHEERELSGAMMSAWANFAETGNLSRLGSLDWPEFTGSNYLQLSTPVSSSTVIERFFPKRMDFWINYIWKKLDVPLEQCTAMTSTQQSGYNCPVCLNEVPSDISETICKAKHAFKVSILTEKILIIEGDLRPVTGKVKLDIYTTYDIESSCSCNVLTEAGESDKLLILTMTTKNNMSSLLNDNGATVIKLDNKLQRNILRAIKNRRCLE